MAGVSPDVLSASVFTALRIIPTLQWLSMARVTSPTRPPWPAYDELHSVLKDLTCSVV